MNNRERIKRVLSSNLLTSALSRQRKRKIITIVSATVELSECKKFPQKIL